ncbi:LLM class F420-dependent oxidoreductase [Streptomyces alkaliterrae]|uniref:LLM class F420-dependent oxidoreductase n=1 Tax=Streptomyces alkaliterrae TaxID=2213162 RepID=A0A5P0YQX8_9ACTN|nr:LLM class F420-dependent oxidoreductase [Streptomyces alkaliterrae]MBB1258941.1 LLM class F420-dependent oxidoreductase [Streptomyces alkaliterrae]MQS02665.1 TIGR03557 family F420-dependent LLM class oxidoreductase [Streptomyces alkaliterrae]
MVRIGYTMMTEQAGPRELVDHVVAAERAGFDFSVTSDHYFPWLASQGHSPYAWSVLGAAAQATSRIPLMTYVTCPTVRYHPAVVAQKAATVQLLSQGRFRLGLGSGENLNEHVVGAGWPTPGVRLEMLEEAVGIIRALFAGGNVNHHGPHFDVANARLWDLPEEPPPIGVAVSGPRSCEIAGRLADLVIATEPNGTLLRDFDRHGGSGKPRVGQLPVCYDPDRSAAVARAHDQFRWSLGPWPVNAQLEGPLAFEGATGQVRPEDVADTVPCGDDVDAFVEAVRAFHDAGFTEIALVQIGGDQQEPFLEWARTKLLPALREL